MTDLIKITTSDNIGFLPVNTEKTNEVIDYIRSAASVEVLDIQIFKAGQMPFDELPEATQQEVKQTLKAFKRCGVTFANGHFRVSTGCYIASHYTLMRFSCGDYYAKDIYTEEERRQNFIESFGYAPVHI